MKNNDETTVANKCKAEYIHEWIPTYVPEPAQILPVFFEKRPYQGASGKIYPLPYTDRLSDSKTNTKYKVAVLENDYIKARVLPEIGGKVQQAYDKKNEIDFVYHNTVIKPAMIGLAGPWVSGGIEFNWPQHHRPTTYMPLESWIKHENGEETVWVGEVDPINRMKGMAGFSISPGKSFLKVKVKLYNRTPFAHPFLWWANTAVAVHDQYRIIFPPDVSWVNDHDRRAVISWPMAKGIYQTARPYDYGDGTDLSLYPSVVVPSSFMVSQGQSDMDFVAGYDMSRDCGVVTVADHYIAPGKKLFHWGRHDFGNNWCANLTDDDGPYVELMTGVFSDNQPDFTWMHPYETKCFEQYWYPVIGIGGVKNATKDAAVNMRREDDGLFVGFNVTGEFQQCHVSLKKHDNTLFEEYIDMIPCTSYTRVLPIDISPEEEKQLSISLKDNNGNILVTYCAANLKEHERLEPRTPAKKPQHIQTIDELYINGLHLEQYKHHTYEPEHYYLEGLKRDPDDSRCNTAMGRIMLKRGCFKAAEKYLSRAIERLTVRNGHPETVDALYLLALCYRYSNKESEAYELLQKCIWQYSHVSAGYYALAEIDAKRKDFSIASERLNLSLQVNALHTKAHCLQSAIYRKMGLYDQAIDIATDVKENDSLEIWCRIELFLAYKALKDQQKEIAILQEISELYARKPENYLDVVNDFMRCGFFDDAVEVLQIADQTYPLILYYLSYCFKESGEKDQAAAYARQAELADNTYCFPSRLEDIAVLKAAAEIYPDGARAHYYLGCLYYDRLRTDEAIRNWQLTIQKNPDFYPAYRNLAIALYDKKGEYLSARHCMDQALGLCKNNARVLLEMQQLLKNINAVPEERLALYDKYDHLVQERDDCYLDRITIMTQLGQYEQAIEMAKNHRFHIYEGGEGQLTRFHAWLHTLYAWKCISQNDLTQAERLLKQALDLLPGYGEGKSYFAQENHVYYTLGYIYERQDRQKEMENAYAEAAVDKSSMSEINLFRALALRKLKSYTQAQQVLQQMRERSEQIIYHLDQWPYFGVGSPTPLPFELDIAKTNTISGYMLRGFALLGLGKENEANEAVDVAREKAPYSFPVYLYDSIKKNSALYL
ncbi:MAG: DUF5107 domain-containing protein [Bacillota bacterium]|nr:DUF5107 domain-containing protein [Bacillota bacterium]